MTSKNTPSRDQMMIEGLDSVLGLGLPTALEFGGPGVTHTLRITRAQAVRSRDFKTGKEESWPSGDPKMILVLVGDSDEGEEASFWVRGKRATDAFRGALAAVNASGVAVGDVWTITRGQDEELEPIKKGGEPVFANTWDMAVIPVGAE